MSYILDALKKADADRRLGTLPGIDSTPSAQGPDRLSLGRRHWNATAAFLSVLLLALGYVSFKLRPGPAPLAPAALVTASVPPAPAVPIAASIRANGVGVVSPGQPDAVAGQAAPVIKTNAAGSVSNTASAKLETDVLVPPALPKLSKRLAIAGNQLSTKMPVPNAPQGLPVTRNRSAPPAIQEAMTFAQLPSEIQHELPPMAISGTMYSPIPADRLLLIDKRMLHEGDEIAPGVTLEGVLPKGARLRYKNYVFQMSY